MEDSGWKLATVFIVAVLFHYLGELAQAVLYVAGDVSRDVLQAIVGAAEGAEAAIAINTA